MKTITKIFLFFALFLLYPSVNAIEEVVLDIDGELASEEGFFEGINDEEWPFDIGGKTLQQKIDEIRTREVKNTFKTHYLLEEILTKKLEKSPIDTVHLFGYYRGNLQMNFYPNDNDLGYDYNDIDLGVNGKFRDGKTFYEARLRFTPQDNYNFLQYLPSDLYIASAAIPNHTIIVGNTRTPTGYEGAKSSTVLPFVARSQISRNFGNTRQVGVRVKGNYPLIEYDFGGFSSDTYFRKFMPGSEFAGWVTLKPLAKTNGKYGSLKIGSGITAGENGSDYFVAGAYTSYEYKRFYANFEWGKANGYNGARGISTNKAEGLYTTLGYRITPKLQFIARYDQFKPNLLVSNDIRREYSTGFNYFLKGQALKLMLNYVFCQNDILKDSHRIIVGTQLVL